MASSFSDSLKHAWNIIRNGDNEDFQALHSPYPFGASVGYRPDRPSLNLANERSMLASIFTRISIDVSAIDIRHVRLDDNGRFLAYVKSDLDNCLSVEANLDQRSRAFIQDAVLTMLETGCVALVPIDTTSDPTQGSYDIKTMRVGEIVDWYPKHVRVKVYNENLGVKQEVVVPKAVVAIIESPLYSVINEPNSTLKRLIRKLNLLDRMDEQSSAGKLDIIIQLPYVIKTEARQQQAEKRRKDIEMQLQGSKYGIAYTDGTERITQLNRPVDNTLVKQVEDLKKDLYAQLGLMPEIFDGSASETAMTNYYSRTIDPIVKALTEEMTRKFLTKTARTQGQSVEFYRDPFFLVPLSSLADISDAFTRNEILSSNEVRGILGFQPSSDPRADELRNKNINPKAPDDPVAAPTSTDQETDPV